MATVEKLDRETVEGLELSKGKTVELWWDNSLRGFGIKLQISTKGKLLRSYVVQYRRNGKQTRHRLGDADRMTAENARKKAIVALGQVELGQDPLAERRALKAASAITFKSVVGQYLDHKHRQLEGDKRRPVTLNNARLYLERGDYFKPLHNKPINAVLRRDVAVRLNSITTDHSANTASAARRFLSAFFTWAMKEGIADSNPVTGTNDPGSNAPRERVLSDDELSRVWKACKDDDFGRAVRLLILTGARRQEVGGMRWSEIDLATGTWKLPGERAKNHRTHTLTLPPLALEIIHSTPRRVDRDHLFGERADKGFTNFQHGKFNTVLEFAEPWHLHDIRRTVATGLANLGVLPHVIETALNHVSGHKSGVAGIYNRSTYPEEVKSALLRWANHIEAIVSGRVEKKVVQMTRHKQSA